MTVKEIMERLELKIAAGEGGLEKEIQGVYICDLLSWVMSHAQKGNVWITVQTNINIVAVAVLTEVGCIIIPEEMEIDPQTIEKANKENIPIFTSALSAYELACKLGTMI